MKGYHKILRTNKEDKSVSEIIGTILIFAIVISLFTTFVLWYVPTIGTSNEQNYQLNAESAFSSLTSEFHSQQPISGNQISKNIPLGIKGVPPFSPSTDTYLSFSSGYSNFWSEMNYSLKIGYFNPSTSTYGNITVNDSFKGMGEISSYGNTQFIRPVEFVIQDGALIENNGQIEPSSLKGPLPVSINNVSGGIHLYSTLLNLTGPDTTASEIGSTLLQFSYGNVSEISYSVGSAGLIGNQLVNITGITLTSFQYSLFSQFYDAWNFSMYREYVNDSAAYNTVVSNSSYLFSNVPFQANVSKNFVLISNSIAAIPLQSVSISYVQLNLLRI